MCQRSGFIIERHNKLFDLEAEMLRMVCNDVEVEAVLQEVNGNTLNHGANKAPEIFGRDRDLHSSTFRFVTLMQTLTET